MAANIPTLTTILDELPDLSEYVAERSCPKEQVAVRLRDGKDTVPNVLNLTTYLNKLPDLLDYRAGGGCNKEQVLAVMLVDGKTTFPDVTDSLASTAFFNEVPDFLEYRDGGQLLRGPCGGGDARGC